MTLSCIVYFLIENSEVFSKPLVVITIHCLLVHFPGVRIIIVCRNGCVRLFTRFKDTFAVVTVDSLDKILPIVYVQLRLKVMVICCELMRRLLLCWSRGGVRFIRAIRVL
jgi:hypothetical protein